MTVIEAIEIVLERAKAGELTGVAIAAVHADLTMACTWAMEEATTVEMVGAVTFLQHRLLDPAKADA